jgi:hypothetical protein
MNIEWVCADGARDTTVAALEEAGAEVRRRSGFEPLTTIAAAAGVVALARALRKLFQDSRFHGVMIDVTKSPAEVREMPGWDRRQVLVVSAAGAQLQTFTEENDLAALLEKLGVAT